MMMMTQITISKTKMTSKDLDMVRMMMTRKDLDMGGGKRTKREESSNSTSSYKEAAECVALAIMIVTCLVSTMFMVITIKVIMIKKVGDLQGQAGQSGEDSSDLSSSLYKALHAKTNLKVGHH